MKITSVTIAKLTIPLIRPFITAVRTTNNVEDVVVIIQTDDGLIGYGSAAATVAITGDSSDSIIAAIQYTLAPKLIGQSIDNLNYLLKMVHCSMAKNTSAKAAIDIALYDLFAKLCKLPLYKFLGGANTNKINTCVTISVKDPETMAIDAATLVQQGFNTLKIKLGIDSRVDIKRIAAIRNSIGSKVTLIADANQGWESKEAICTIKQLTQYGIKFIEQPVQAHNLRGLKDVTNGVDDVIIADEACFSPYDAFTIAKNHYADGVNIKLMKSGGIYNALAMYSIATAASLECIVGSMLESPIGIAAAASFAISRTRLLGVDLDSLALIAKNPVIGGASIEKDQIQLSEKPGLGIESIKDCLSILTKIN